MFQRRLMVFIALLVLVMLILLTRLVWLQYFQADVYLQKTQASFEKPPKWLETVRGNIYDCKGRTLATVQASYQVCLHYQLTALFDERFYEYQVTRTGRLKKHKGKNRDQLEDIVRQTTQQDLASAKSILDELAELCRISPQSLYESIAAINDRINDLQILRARKVYCRRHNIDYVSQPNMAAIREDFIRLVPDESERNYLIGREKVFEMTAAQPAISNISKDIALDVEERFSQKLLGGNVVVVVRPKKVRTYPYADVACHIIGHTGPAELSERSDSIPPTEEDLNAYFPFDRKGAQGAEYMFEPLLRGRRGWEYKDIYGRELAETIEPWLGTDVSLTLDIELQKTIQQLFEAKGYTGASVIIDVPTGQVRALVSVPTYDLNTYYHHDSYKQINDPDDPLKRRLNRALMVDYQPGSTVKPIMLLGALEGGFIQESDHILCDMGNKDWVGPPSDIENHGSFNAIDAIRESCNFYFVKVGERLGLEGMTAWLDRIGRNRRILAWPADYAGRSYRAFGETAGHVKPIGRTALSMADLRFVAFGRGSLDGSLLQIANTTATIARYGLHIDPTLVISPQTEQKQIPVASRHYARIVEKAMKAVVTDPRGSGYYAYQLPLWPEDQVKVYGKTGSTNYSLFTCYVRSMTDDTCLAVAVLVEVEEFGRLVAAPLSRDILKCCAQQGYLPETLGYLNADEVITY